jgi:hypothetical protein
MQDMLGHPMDDSDRVSNLTDRKDDMQNMLEHPMDDPDRVPK